MSSFASASPVCLGMPEHVSLLQNNYSGLCFYCILLRHHIFFFQVLFISAKESLFRNFPSSPHPWPLWGVFLPFPWDQEITPYTTFLKRLSQLWVPPLSQWFLHPAVHSLKPFHSVPIRPAVTVDTRDLNLLKLKLVSSQALLPLITSSLPTVQIHKLTYGSYNALSPRVATNSCNFFA